MNPHSRAVMVAILGLVVLSSPAIAIIDGQTDGTTHRFVGAVDIRAAGAPIVASGVLVSPMVLLTAGHVTAFFDRAGQTRARVTFDPIASESATWHWGTVHTNPAFLNQEFDPGDLGVIVFDEPIVGITPVSLPSESFLEQFNGKGHNDVAFELVGFGTSIHVGDSNDHGLGAFAGDGTRKFMRVDFDNVEHGWVKFAPLDGNVCYGDSGGPVMLGSVAVSILRGHTNPNFCKGDIFEMRLDTAEHREFLRHYVALP